MNENRADIVGNRVSPEHSDLSSRQNAISVKPEISEVRGETREALGVDDDDPLEVVGCGWGSDRCM